MHPKPKLDKVLLAFARRIAAEFSLPELPGGTLAFDERKQRTLTADCQPTGQMAVGMRTLKATITFWKVKVADDDSDYCRNHLFQAELHLGYSHYTGGWNGCGDYFLVRTEEGEYFDHVRDRTAISIARLYHSHEKRKAEKRKKAGEPADA